MIRVKGDLIRFYFQGEAMSLTVTSWKPDQGTLWTEASKSWATFNGNLPMWSMRWQ